MSLTLRYMALADIPQVVHIDRASFGMPWSPRSYAYEITESHYSHMVVLEYTPPAPQTPFWMRWMQNFLPVSPAGQRRIVAYGGLWRVMEEAHISTIASHPDWRGRSFGEILLAAMVYKSIMLQASYVVLEVRVGNTIAQNLYKKYNFVTAGIKPRYYRDNGEDAFDMRIQFDSRSHAEYARRFYDLQKHHGFVDEFVKRDIYKDKLNSFSEK